MPCTLTVLEACARTTTILKALPEGPMRLDYVQKNAETLFLFSTFNIQVKALVPRHESGFHESIVFRKQAAFM